MRSKLQTNSYEIGTARIFSLSKTNTKKTNDFYDFHVLSVEYFLIKARPFSIILCNQTTRNDF